LIKLVNDVRKVLYAIRTQSLREVIGLITEAMEYRLGQRFDRIHRVETWEYVIRSRLGFGVEVQRVYSDYRATPVRTLRALLSRLPRNTLSSSTFVDFGLGKGRVLLVAADFTFRRIIGVEFSDELRREFFEVLQEMRAARHATNVPRSHDDPMRRQQWARREWPPRHERKQKTAEQRRERYLTRGAIKFFWGGGLTIFLYFIAHALVLKLPPDVIAKIPFEIDPVVHVIWLLGLIPMLSGVGHILAGLSIRPGSRPAELPEQKPLRIDPPIETADYPSEVTIAMPRSAPASVTDRTTNILDRDPARRTSEI